MDDSQKARLERYFKNARRFLWGLGPGNQEKTYEWLRTQGYEFSRAPYAIVTRTLLENVGIERLFREVIVPRVQDQFTAGVLDYFRACWNAGSRPDLAVLAQFNVKDVTPFIEVNNQLEYVEGWSELAPVWFEEIEPIVRNSSELPA